MGKEEKKAKRAKVTNKAEHKWKKEDTTEDVDPKRGVHSMRMVESMKDGAATTNRENSMKVGSFIKEVARVNGNIGTVVEGKDKKVDIVTGKNTEDLKAKSDKENTVQLIQDNK